jgi:hypothetical protein
MTQDAKNAPAGGADGPLLELSSLGGVDIKAISFSQGPTQGKKRGGRASRDKGSRLERAIVRLFQDHSLGAERIPLSGSAGGSY